MKLASQQPVARRSASASTRSSFVSGVAAVQRRRPGHFRLLAEADVGAPPAAAAAEDTMPAAPAVDASAAAQPVISWASGNMSSNSQQRNPVMYISAQTSTNAAAAYLCSKLQEAAPGNAIRMRATAQMPSVKVLAIIAKTQELLAAAASSHVVTFQVQRGRGKPGDPPTMAVFDFFVSKAPSDSFNGHMPTASLPMLLKPDTQVSKVADHAMRNTKRQAQQQQTGAPVAAFRVEGPARGVREGVKTLLTGLSNARRQLTAESQLDLTFRLERTTYEEERHQKTQQEDTNTVSSEADQALAGETDEAEVEPEAGAAESSADAQQHSSSSSSSTTVTRVRILLSIYVCQPRDSRPAAAGRTGRKDSTSSRKDSASSQGSPAAVAATGRSTRPGYIEVPAEEWAQLKEQLEVVPHLTEQLQIMTRQHEQLLSLLAAQGQAGPAPGAGAQQQQ